jgi:DivIVA domain-containing protein
MEMTPRSIQERRFHDAFRGYDHEEVDVFLDEVADAFDAIYRENQEVRIKVKRLEERLVEAEGTEDMLKRTLLAAQRTADEAVEEARAKAQEILEAARTEAAEIIAEAQNQGREIVSGAKADAESASQRAEELKSFEAEYRARLRQVIKGHLEELAAEPLSAPSASPKQQAETSKSGTQSPEDAGGSPPHERTPPKRAAEAGGPSGAEVRPASRPAKPLQPTVPAATSEAVPGTGDDPSDEDGPSEDREDAVYLDEDSDDDRSITELFWGDD